jgi:PTH2 family peptidyl-tRNA hydrolase
MKQVIIMRREFPDGNGGIKKLRRGKEIAQACHASMAFLLKGGFKSDDLTEWLRGGQTKVCLQIHSEKELLELHKKAKEMGLTSNIITDAGRTEFGGVPTKTCMAIGPNKSKDIDKVTGDLKLY